MSQQQSEPFPLLALPDPCLLAVRQCCAVDDQRSLFSAARAHSRLHQAAAMALHSITADVRNHQQFVNVMWYLARKCRRIGSLGPVPGLFGREPLELALHQLPPSLQLHNLELERFCVQLQPGNGFRGVLGAAAATAGAPPLKQLRLSWCSLLGGDSPSDLLAAGLRQLPVLEHIILYYIIEVFEGTIISLVSFPTGVLQHLPHLTYLELAGVDLIGPNGGSRQALQPLQALTRLVYLSLAIRCPDDQVTARMLSGMHDLTYLELDNVPFQPEALAGKTKLQHLDLSSGSVCGRAAALLSQLQHLQQLTHLTLQNNLQDGEYQYEEPGEFPTAIDWGFAFRRPPDGIIPPAAAYSALTASSKLQHLDISWCKLPAGVWQHMFSADRQLPHLRHLNLSSIRQPLDSGYPGPGQLIASCCTGLQSVDVDGIQCTDEQLRALSDKLKECWQPKTVTGPDALAALNSYLSGLSH